MSQVEPRRSVSVRLAGACLLALALAGCSSSGSSSGGMMSMFKGSSEPAPAPAAGGTAPPGSSITDIECPSVEILDGGAAIRNESGGNVRSQLSIRETARECQLVGNQIAIKIGVEGLALLGPSGSPGSFSVPVRFVAKRGEKVIASRFQRSSVTIPAGEAQASFAIVEDNILVPVDGEDLTLIVGFDPQGKGAVEPAPKRRR